MKINGYRLKAAGAAASLLIIALVGCQTDKVVQRHFPPEKRFTLDPSRPFSGTGETMSVIFSYRYTIVKDQPTGRKMAIEGHINRFKIKPDFLVLHINFLDDQGDAIDNRLIYTLRNRSGRDSYFGSSTSFATELKIPDKTAFYAFSSFSRMSRGRR